MANYENKSFTGNVSVAHDLAVGHDATVRGIMKVSKDLKVGGAILSPFVNSANMGLFPTEADLKAYYPNPRVGMYAAVGDTFPCELYVCEVAGTWKDSGKEIGNEVTEDQLRTFHQYVDTKVGAEKTRAEGVEGTLQQSVTTLNTNLSGEVTRATAAEQGLATAIATEKSRAEGAESTLDGKITTTVEAEKSRAMAAESALDTKIETERSDRDSEEALIYQAIATEKNRAEGAESTLSTAIATEKSRAEGAESTLDGKITTTVNAEKSRAMGVELTLNRGKADVLNVSNLVSFAYRGQTLVYDTYPCHYRYIDDENHEISDTYRWYIAVCYEHKGSKGSTYILYGETEETETAGWYVYKKYTTYTSSNVPALILKAFGEYDGDFVHKSGNETIAGNKTFSNNVVVEGNNSKLTVKENDSSVKIGKDYIFVTHNAETDTQIGSGNIVIKNGNNGTQVELKNNAPSVFKKGINATDVLTIDGKNVATEDYVKDVRAVFCNEDYVCESQEAFIARELDEDKYVMYATFHGYVLWAHTLSGGDNPEKNHVCTLTLFGNGETYCDGELLD